jgi:hypothetical protein
MIAAADTFFCIATSEIGSYFGLVASGKNARYDRVVSDIQKHLSDVLAVKLHLMFEGNYLNSDNPKALYCHVINVSFLFFLSVGKSNCNLCCDDETAERPFD